MNRPEHQREGFQCIECGETFDTALGIERHRPRCQTEDSGSGKELTEDAEMDDHEHD